MGALIATKGTRRLIRHFNALFNVANIGNTKATITGNNTLNFLFSNPSGTTPVLANITNANALFAPNPHVNHPNLLKRWMYFLRHELTFANHERIRSGIWQGLNGTNLLGVTYIAIRFDCIEGPIQQVWQSDEYFMTNNDDDSQPTNTLDPNAPYLKITLVTQPTKAPDALDPQGVNLPP
jgi:hypothetical protein